MRRSIGIAAFAMVLSSASLAQEVVTQQQYATMSACHGHFTGGGETLNRVLPNFAFAADQQANLEEASVSAVEIASEMDANLRFAEGFEPSLNPASGRSSYDAAYAPWADLPSLPIADQWEYWRANAKISDECIHLHEVFSTLRLIMEAAEE